MGYFKKIKLNNYRNFQNYENDFSKNCNVLYGKNGSGKTNILESLSLFVKGKGIRNDNLNNLIKLKEKKFFNSGDYFYLNQNYNIQIQSEASNNKLIKKISINNDYNRETINYFYSLIGFLVFLPEMDRLFLLSPKYRRSFIDRFIFSKNKKYNILINNYKKNLSERNKILMSNTYDGIWIKKIEEEIAFLGLEIYKFRFLQIQNLQEHISKLNHLQKNQFFIVIKHIDKSYNDNVDIEFYKEQLKQNREIDKLIGGSKFGPHKSDFMCYLNDTIPASQLSTGQQKSLVLMLILAQCNYLVNETNVRPIILMDEVCSHLDKTNRSILLKIIEDFDLQIFMTGTEKNFFSFLSTNTTYYNITV